MYRLDEDNLVDIYWELGRQSQVMVIDGRIWWRQPSYHILIVGFDDAAKLSYIDSRVWCRQPSYHVLIVGFDDDSQVIM